VHACAGHKDGKACRMAFACAGKDSDRGYLGIRMQEVEGGLAEALDVEENSGVLINDVVDDSPADEAGLEAGDIVVAVADEDVETPSDLQSAVRANKPGDEIEIRFLRDGKTRTVTAKLAEAPGRRDEFLHQVKDLPCKLGGKLEKFHLAGEYGFLGVHTQPLRGDLGEYFGVEEGEGALVTEVVEDSPAEKLGLEAGDVIIEVAGEEVEDPGDLREIVSAYDEETEVEVVWIRDRKKRDGKTTLEIREGALERTFNISLWDDDDDFDDDHHVRISPRQMRRHHLPEDVIIEKRLIREDMDETIEELREELQELRKELQELQKDLSSD
jgi:membrane-associated protease RseP (regulator of RpoE activity)